MAEPAIPPPAERKTKPTRYMVLRQGGAANDGPAWVEVGKTSAASDTKAIEQVAKGEGTYVAVPARSFRPRTRKVQTIERTLWE